MHFKDSSTTIKLLGKAFVATFASLLIAGCGGSGGGGVGAVSYTLPTVPPGTVSISSSNFSSVAADAAASSTGTMNAGAGGVTGVSTSGGGTAAVPTDLNTAINRANKLLVDTATGSQTAAGVSQTVDCNGYDTTWGTETVSVDTSGNYLIVFNSCGDPAGTVINGSMAAMNFTYSGTPGTPPFSFSVSYSYNLTTTDSTLSTSLSEMGSFDISVSVGTSTTSSTISSGTMGMVDNVSGNAIVISNLNTTRSCDSYNSSTYACTGMLTINGGYTVAGTLSGGSATISMTNVMMNVGNGAMYPNSGTISVAGSGGSSLTITAYDDDLGTNGIYGTSPGTVVSVTWNDGTTSGTTNYTSWTSI